MEARRYQRLSGRDDDAGGKKDEEKKEEVSSEECLNELIKIFNAWVQEFSPSHSSSRSGESKSAGSSEDELVLPGADSFQKMVHKGFEFLYLLEKDHHCDPDKIMSAFVSRLAGKIIVLESDSSASVSAASGIASPDPVKIQLTIRQLEHVSQQIFYQLTKMSAQVDSERLPAAYTYRLRTSLVQDKQKPVLISYGENEESFIQTVNKLFNNTILLLKLLHQTVSEKLSPQPVYLYPLQNLFLKFLQRNFYPLTTNIFSGLDSVIRMTAENEIFPTQNLSQKLISLNELLKTYHSKQSTEPNAVRILDELGRDTIILIKCAYEQQRSLTSRTMGVQITDVYQEANKYQKKWSKCPEFLMSDTDKMRLLKAIAAIALGVVVWGLGIGILSIVVGCICKYGCSVSVIHCLTLLWHQAEAGAVIKSVTGVFAPVIVSASGFFGYKKFRYYGHLNSPLGQALTAVAEEMRNLPVAQQEHRSNRGRGVTG